MFSLQVNPDQSATLTTYEGGAATQYELTPAQFEACMNDPVDGVYWAGIEAALIRHSKE